MKIYECRDCRDNNDPNFKIEHGEGKVPCQYLVDNAPYITSDGEGFYYIEDCPKDN